MTYPNEEELSKEYETLGSKLDELGEEMRESENLWNKSIKLCDLTTKQLGLIVPMLIDILRASNEVKEAQNNAARDMLDDHNRIGAKTIKTKRRGES